MVRVTLLKKHEIQVLLRAGHKQKEVAQLVGVSLRTVQRVASQPTIRDLKELALRVGRASSVDVFRAQVVTLLQTDPTVRARDILERLREEGYTGGKTAVYDLVSSLRRTQHEGFPGAFSEHDYGRTRVRLVDGSTAQIALVASRLCYSGCLGVSVVAELTVQTVADSVLRHFEDWDGVPLIALFVNPRSDKLFAQPQWKMAFADVAMSLGLGVETDPSTAYAGLTRRKPRPMAAVTSAIRALAPFASSADVTAKLNRWVSETNADPRHGGPTLFAEEQRRLRSLKFSPDQVPFRFVVCVQPNGVVEFQGERFVMPPGAASRPGILSLYSGRVQIRVGTVESWHPWPSGTRKRIE